MLFLTNRIIASCLLTGLILCVAPRAAGQGGDPQVREILHAWQAHYEASIKSIDDYVVVKEDQTVYYKKAHDNGRPYFKSRVEDADERELASGSNLTDAEVFSRVYQAVLENAEYKGRDEVNGHPVQVLYLEKVEQIFDEPWAPQELREVYLKIDPDKWVLRELAFQVTTQHEGEERVINQVMQSRDYRDVEGMQIPFETAVMIKGLALTEEERREAEEGLAEMERELEAMPQAQRHMVERMMGDRMRQAKQMLEGDVYETVNRVLEVRVNTGMEDF